MVDSPLLMQQIAAQRLSIKHLKNENNRLKVRGSMWQKTQRTSMCFSGGENLETRMHFKEKKYIEK